MEVTVEKSSGLQRKLKVKVPSDQLQNKIDTRLREIGKQVKIKGFRPGRIPQKILKQRYGKSVQREIVTELVQSSIVEAIEKESLRPASNPVLENLPDMAGSGDLEFTASIEVYPEIESIDAAAIELERPQSDVTEADVDDMLQTLRQQRQTWVDIEGKPSKGNQVVVEYVAETDAGRVPAQGRQRLSLLIGSSGFDVLEKAVTGLKAGGTKKLKIKFPESYGDQQLAGKKAVLDLKVMQIQRAQVPEIDEAFIKSFSIESGSIDDLRQQVRDNLERELDQAMKSYLKSQLLRKLLDTHAELEVPASIVEQEADSLKTRAATAQGVEPDTVPVEPFMDAAIDRVRSGLLLAEIARKNNIIIDGARVRKAIETVAETYEQPLEVVQMYYGNQRLLQSVENTVLEAQVVDWVMDQARVSDEPMAFKEVINAASAEGQAS